MTMAKKTAKSGAEISRIVTTAEGAMAGANPARSAKTGVIATAANRRMGIVTFYQ
jgi:hypothetical protein